MDCTDLYFIHHTRTMWPGSKGGSADKQLIMNGIPKTRLPPEILTQYGCLTVTNTDPPFRQGQSNGKNAEMLTQNKQGQHNTGLIKLIFPINTVVSGPANNFSKSVKPYTQFMVSGCALNSILLEDDILSIQPVLI